MTDTNSYDPLKKPAHSKTELAKLFTGDGRALQRLRKENPDLYVLYRKQAEALGIVAPRPVWADPNYRDRFADKPMSEETIRLRATVSEAEVRGYYTSQSNGNKNNLSRLATTDPERYRLVKSAAIAWGIIPEQAMPREPEPKPVQHETMFTVSDENCQRLGLAKGTQVGQAQFLKIAEIVYKVDEAKAKAAAQDAKDRAVDASLATVGHIVEQKK
jgi:hypothetical protein